MDPHLEAFLFSFISWHVYYVSDNNATAHMLWKSYVYWALHHLDSWIKRDQLDVTCFFISLFNAQHVSDVNTSILWSLQLICWVISWVVLLWFDVCWCYGVVWQGWCGIQMQAEALALQPASAFDHVHWHGQGWCYGSIFARIYRIILVIFSQAVYKAPW